MEKLNKVPDFWLTAKISENIFNEFGTYLQFDQPFPAYNTRFPGKLEGILESVRQTFDNQPLNATILDAAAAYFNQIIRGHPFQNGNKRFAVLLTHYFLLMNGVDFTLSFQGMYNFALGVALFSKDLNSEQTKRICKKIIAKYTKEISL